MFAKYCTNFCCLAFNIWHLGTLTHRFTRKSVCFYIVIQFFVRGLLTGPHRWLYFIGRGKIYMHSVQNKVGFFSEWWLLLFAYETLTSKTICIPTSLTKPAVFSGKLAGFDAATDRQVMDADHLGPLPSVPVKTIDWLLVFSVLFITGFTVYAILRTDSIRWLVPGQEHEHQDWKHNTRCDCKSLDVNDYLMNYLVCS